MTTETISRPAHYHSGKPTLWQKLNPVWWLLNQEEPAPPADYKPTSAHWWRTVSWYLRNPFQNGSRFVFGVCDRDCTVTGPVPVAFTTYVDAGLPGGWKWCVTRTNKLGLRLPFVSFENDSVIFYGGWQFSGFFGFKFNLKRSPFQLW